MDHIMYDKKVKGGKFLAWIEGNNPLLSDLVTAAQEAFPDIPFTELYIFRECCLPYEQDDRKSTCLGIL